MTPLVRVQCASHHVAEGSLLLIESPSHSWCGQAIFQAAVCHFLGFMANFSFEAMGYGLSPSHYPTDYVNSLYIVYTCHFATKPLLDIFELTPSCRVQLLLS